MNLHRPLLAVGILGAVLMAVACSDDDSPGGIAYNYTVNSTQLSVGRKAGVGRAVISGTCNDITVDSNTRRHAGDGTVTEAGTVTFAFTDSPSPIFFETVYIDVDASGTMNGGDIVWGTAPNIISGGCFPSDKATTDTVPWDVIATSIGSFVWAGVNVSYLREPLSSAPIIDFSIAIDANRWSDR